jgi:hypothetical protein
LIWLSFSTLFQDPAIHDVVLLLGLNVPELDNTFPTDSVSNFLSGEVQPSFASGHISFLA